MIDMEYIARAEHARLQRDAAEAKARAERNADIVWYLAFVLVFALTAACGLSVIIVAR